jgi:transposase
MTPDEKRAYAQSFPVHVGVDTAKQTHVLVARGPDGRRSKPVPVKVSRAGFEAAHATLRAMYPTIEPRQMLIGLEFAGHHGFTFAAFLARQGYPIVNILPAHTKKTKELEDNSPLKTDAKDAAQICKLVGDGTFVRFPFLEAPFVELRLLVTQRYRLTVEETRFKNRLQGLLDLAWPEFMGQFSNLRKLTPGAILRRWPLPADLLAAKPAQVARVIQRASRGHVGEDRVQALFASARTSIALTDAASERRLEIEHLFARWDLVREQIARLDERIAAMVTSCPEAHVLTSLPEVSATCAATIVAELGTPGDYVHPRQVLKLAGMNLVEKSSGFTRGRKRQSKRGRPMLRRQLFLLAGRWCQPRGLYRAEYEAMLARNGGLRTKAVCAIARKLVPLLLAVMQSGEPFDLARWQAGRKTATPGALVQA